MSPNQKCTFMKEYVYFYKIKKIQGNKNHGRWKVSIYVLYRTLTEDYHWIIFGNSDNFVSFLFHWDGPWPKWIILYTGTKVACMYLFSMQTLGDIVLTHLLQLHYCSRKREIKRICYCCVCIRIRLRLDFHIVS